MKVATYGSVQGVSDRMLADVGKDEINQLLREMWEERITRTTDAVIINDLAPTIEWLDNPGYMRAICDAEGDPIYTDDGRLVIDNFRYHVSIYGHVLVPEVDA